MLQQLCRGKLAGLLPNLTPWHAHLQRQLQSCRAVCRYDLILLHAFVFAACVHAMCGQQDQKDLEKISRLT